MSSLEHIKTCYVCEKAKSQDSFYLKNKVTKRYSNTCKECERLKREKEKPLPVTDTDELSEMEEFEEIVGFFEILNKWNKDIELKVS